MKQSVGIPILTNIHKIVVVHTRLKPTADTIKPNQTQNFNAIYFRAAISLSDASITDAHSAHLTGTLELSLGAIM